MTAGDTAVCTVTVVGGGQTISVLGSGGGSGLSFPISTFFAGTLV